jgi:circadian clock protein KaiB
MQSVIFKGTLIRAGRKSEMINKQPTSSATQAFELALSDPPKTMHILKLYIAGNTSRSAQAIMNIRKICEERLKGQYQLEVIDIYQQPSLAKGEQIIATPTLIKFLPYPLRRVIGDLSKTERILVGLDLVKTDR